LKIIHIEYHITTMLKTKNAINVADSAKFILIHLNQCVYR